MTNADFIAALVARRDALITKHAALVTSGQRFAAEDMAADVRFAIRAANDALMGKS